MLVYQHHQRDMLVNDVLILYSMFNQHWSQYKAPTGRYLAYILVAVAHEHIRVSSMTGLHSCSFIVHSNFAMQASIINPYESCKDKMSMSSCLISRICHQRCGTPAPWQVRADYYSSLTVAKDQMTFCCCSASIEASSRCSCSFRICTVWWPKSGPAHLVLPGVPVMTGSIAGSVTSSPPASAALCPAVPLSWLAQESACENKSPAGFRLQSLCQANVSALQAHFAVQSGNAKQLDKTRTACTSCSLCT